MSKDVIVVDDDCQEQKWLLKKIFELFDEMQKKEELFDIWISGSPRFSSKALNLLAVLELEVGVFGWPGVVAIGDRDDFEFQVFKDSYSSFKNYLGELINGIND